MVPQNLTVRKTWLFAVMLGFVGLLGCTQSRFYVEATAPVEGEATVSRTSAVILQFIADDEIDEEEYEEDEF